MTHIYQSYIQLSIQLESKSGFSKRISFNGEDNTFCTTDEQVVQLLDENAHLGYYVKLAPPLAEKYMEKDTQEETEEGTLQENTQEDVFDEEDEWKDEPTPENVDAIEPASEEPQEEVVPENLPKEVSGLTTLAQIRDYLNKAHKVPFNRMKNAEAIMQEAEELGVTFIDYPR